MEKELENIFVLPKIGILALRKGFKEWCACLYNESSNDIFPNYYISENNTLSFDFDYYTSLKTEIQLPTHFQLIAWLQTNHNIHLSFDKSRKLSVFIPEKSSFKFITENGESEFEINKALEIALNTLPNVL